jgi:hypothetical protein
MHSAGRTAKLQALERLRLHREQRALRELQQAREAEQQAQAALEQAQAAQHAIEVDIQQTLQRPFQTQAGAAHAQGLMADVQRSRRRAEWLAEDLVQAKAQVREAQTNLQAKTTLRQAALRQHLLACARHEAVQTQRQRSHRSDLAWVERQQLEEAQERGLLRQALQAAPIAPIAPIALIAPQHAAQA